MTHAEKGEQENRFQQIAENYIRQGEMSDALNSKASMGTLSDQELAERYPGFTVVDRHNNLFKYGFGHRFETNLDSSELYIYVVQRETWKMDNLRAVYRDWTALHLNDAE